MSILWVSADKRAAMRTTSYPVYRTPVLIWYRYTVKLIILTITNSKDDAIENTFGTQKSRWKTSCSFHASFLLPAYQRIARINDKSDVPILSKTIYVTFDKSDSLLSSSLIVCAIHG